MTHEVNFDGLVGPTHNYAGLSYGNLASYKNKMSESSPRKAALQGLEKMKYLMDRGVVQGILPPQVRPALSLLRNLGYEGTDKVILNKAFQHDPLFFLQCSSASAMWAANAAMVSPSVDCLDRKVHITPANLISNFHRSIETNFTAKILKFIFKNKTYFTVHDPLPGVSIFSDEGAANFCRITKDHGKKGLEVFVHGREALKNDNLNYPARQTSKANLTHIRRHQLSKPYYFDIRQNARVINHGVFHNDVISVSNENLFLYHELAFSEKGDLNQLQEMAESVTNGDVHFIKVLDKDLSVKEAVQTYLFNSQIITLSKGKMLLLAPQECKNSKMAQKVIHKILESNNPIQEVHYMDLRESMRNGGGPACLRLRVVLTEKEQGALSGNILLTNALYKKLVDWVNEFYPEKLMPADLKNYQLYCQNQIAFEELEKILRLPLIFA